MSDLSLRNDPDGFAELWEQACMAASYQLAEPIRLSASLSWRSGLSWPDVERAVASCYAATYAEMPEVMDAYREELDAFLAERSLGSPTDADTRRELLCAAIVSGATEHAYADLDLSADDFTYRAFEMLDVREDIASAYGKIRDPAKVALAAKAAASNSTIEGQSEVGRQKHGIL